MGRVANRFVLEELAGRGGMGEVHRATDTHTGDRVALKLLRMEGPAARQRFELEAELLAILDHPTLIRFVDVGHDPTHGQWLAMEWVDGPSLTSFLEERGPLSIRDFLELALPLAEGIGTFHERGVVHRDLKPGNVLLDGNDPQSPRLLDFGVARAGRSGATKPGMILGTPGHIAPEQIRGEVVTPRADVFALGALFYECLSGAAAFAGDQPLATFAKTLLEAPPELRILRPEIPVAIAQLITAMLSKTPETRPANALEVATELKRIAAGDEVAIRVPPSVGGEERRMLSLLVGERRSLAEQEHTMSDVAAEEERDRIQGVAEQHGARLEMCSSMSFAITVPRGSVGTDAPRQAVRCGLALASVLPEHCMAAATLRADASAGGIGETIERAARLLPRNSAPAGGVMVDEVSAALLDGRFVIEIGSAGRCVREERSGPPAARVGAPFVGRERELKMLRTLLTDAYGRGEPLAALVIGEGGIGKSRLGAELGRRCKNARLMWLRASPQLANTPFALARELLPLIDLEGALAALQNEALTSRIRALMSRPKRPTIVPIDPERSASELRSAVAEVLRAASDNSALLLIIDDAQHADAPSLEVFDELLRERRGAIGILALGLPSLDERHPGLWNRRPTMRLHLGRLSDEAARELVRATLGDTGDDASVQGILNQGEGNPFHLEELARQRDDESRDSLLSIVEDRLTALPSGTRRVLRAAAIFGEEFDVDGVRALVARSDHDSATAAALRRAVEAEMLVVEDQPGRHRFRHRLVRDAAYAMLPERDRETGHRLAAEWLARQGAEDATLADHYERGRKRRWARHHYLRAAASAFAGDFLVGVAEYAERVLALDPEDPEAAQAWHWLAESYAWRGRTAEALDAAEQALRLGTRGSEHWIAALGTALVAAGGAARGDELDAHSATLLAHEPSPRQRRVFAYALVRAVNQLFYSGRPARAREALEKLEGLVDEADPDLSPRLAQARSVAASLAGDVAGSIRWMRASAEGLSARFSRKARCATLSNLGSMLLGAGLYEEAEATLRDALAIGEHLELQGVALATRLNLVGALLRRGALEEAASLARKTIDALEGTGEVRLLGAARVVRARTQVALGDVAGARRSLRSALATLEEPSTFRALALAEHARLAPDTEGAKRDAMEAMRILQALGGLEEGDGVVHLARVETLLAAGETEEARTCLHVAVGQLRERVQTADPDTQAAMLGMPENTRLCMLAEAQDIPSPTRRS